MRFTYTLQYRDEKEAARARFAGEPVERGPAAAPRGAAFGWAALVVFVVAVALLSAVFASGRGLRPSLVAAASEVDGLENPLFGVGLAMAGFGACLFAIPVAYLIGRHRSALPIHADPVTATLDEQGVVLRSEHKEFRLAWDGVVAVVELRNVFVLKTIGDLKLTFPKRSLEEDRGVNDLREALRRRVPPMAEVARRLAA